MKHIMVRYKVKADRAEDNINYIKAVFEGLAAENPAGLRYASFHLDDGVSFVHLASIETSDGKNPLAEVGAFKKFQEDIKDRCEEPPVAFELQLIGNFKHL